jgi:hypothetical protein
MAVTTQRDEIIRVVVVPVAIDMMDFNILF